MNRIYFLAIALSCIYIKTQSQDIASVLRSVERNNMELKVLHNDNQAAIFEIKDRNSLESPSVEYSPFFRKGASGVASSELVVSQDFDFPTLYATRHKSGKLQQEAINLEYMTLRRNILLDAKQKCLELVLLNFTRDVLKERADNAGELLVLFEKKFKEGDATIIELNKIKMEQMDLQAEMLQNESSRQNIIRALTAMNGNKPLSLDSISYPEITATYTENGMLVKGSALSLQEEIIASDAVIRTAEAAVRMAEQEIKVSKQGWLPKLSIGYRRNTEMDESSNGFLVGAAFPIFSNTNKVKAAKSKQVAAQLNLDNTRMKVENETETIINEFRRLGETLRIYDMTMIRQSAAALKKAVVTGNMSLIDYYNEVDKIYQKQQTFLAVENQYHNLWATLNKNRL